MTLTYPRRLAHLWRLPILAWPGAFAAVGMACAVAAQAADLPHTADIRYDVVWGFISLEAEQHWRLQGGAYTLSTELKLPLGLKNRRYLSNGQVTAQGLEPGNYEESQIGDAAPGHVARFDRATRTLRYGKPDSLKNVPLEAGLQDMNALAMQLAFLGSRAVGKTIAVTNGKGVVLHHFESAPSRAMVVNGRSVETEGFLSHSGEGEIEIWLAPSLGNLPVSVVRSQDGRAVRFVARQVLFTP